ncbi:unnamed protein product [Discula destructiva]
MTEGKDGAKGVAALAEAPKALTGDVPPISDGCANMNTTYSASNGDLRELRRVLVGLENMAQELEAKTITAKKLEATDDAVVLEESKGVANLQASRESNVVMTDAKRKRIVDSQKGKAIAGASVANAVQDNIEARASAAVKKHGTN